MIYKIVEISTDKRTGLTYFLVHFWRTVVGPRPDRVNDFFMQLRPTRTVIVTKDGKWKRADGTFVDRPESIDDPLEWGWETIDNDLPGIIEKNIKAYWGRAEKGSKEDYPVMHSDPRVKRDNSDPHGALRDDVMALKDAEVSF